MRSDSGFHSQFDDLLRIALGATKAVLTICNHGPKLNERYLHHFMSHVMQKRRGILDLQSTKGELLLHPEWPTWKKRTKVFFGQYQGQKKNGRKEFHPVTLQQRGAGFIDFALGQYNSPEVAIELSLKNDWDHEKVVYDFVKLLDGRNRTFRAVISCNIVMRPHGLARGGNKERLHRRMCEAHDAALNRLGELACDENRLRLLLVSEVANDERRHWYFDEASCDFLATGEIPPILTHPNTDDVSRQPAGS